MARSACWLPPPRSSSDRHRHRRPGLPDRFAALIAVALQRVGRAGHWRGAIPKGRFFATTRDDLLECAATVRAIKQGDLDVLRIPPAPLDILAQQIVAMCACEDWDEDELFEFMRGAYPYRQLKREEYDRILEMLSAGIAAKRGRYGAYLFRDMVNRGCGRVMALAWPPSPAEAPFRRRRCSPSWRSRKKLR